MADLEIDNPIKGVTRIRMNRPDRLNALTPPMLNELKQTLTRISLDDSCRVVIMTGAGRGFCSGVDLGYVDAAATDNKGKPVRLMSGQWEWCDLTPRLRAVRQPIISAVNGPATGAGLAMVLGSDIRLAASSATFAASFVRIGLSGADMGTSWLLPRIVGAARAQELLLTGRLIDSEEALRIGLVVELVPDDQLEARSLYFAELVIANSPFGVAMTKEVMWSSLETSALLTALATEVRTQALCACTEDHWEAAEAFVGKRAPRWANE
jgi:enoyl-CoA hydratase